MAAVCVPGMLSTDKDGFNENRDPGKSKISQEYARKGSIHEGLMHNTKGSRQAADQRELLLRYRHVYAGKGGWYGYRGGGKYGPISTSSNTSSNSGLAGTSKSSKTPFVPHKYRKEILMKISKTLRNEQYTPRHTGEQRSMTGKAQQEKIGTGAKSSGKSIDKFANTGSSMPGVAREGASVHEPGRESWGIGGSYSLQQSQQQLLYVDTAYSTVDIPAQQQGLSRNRSVHTNPDRNIIGDHYHVKRPNRSIHSACHDSERGQLISHRQVATVKVEAHTQGDMMKTREQMKKYSFDTMDNSRTMSTCIPSVSPRIRKELKENEGKKGPRKVTRSTRQNMNLFSRLSMEAQAALHETRVEMGLDRNQDGEEDDDYEDEYEEDYDEEDEDMMNTGRSVDIELVTINPNENVESTDNQVSDDHHNHIHGAMCSCRTRTGIVFKGAKETIRIPAFAQSPRTPFQSNSLVKGGGKIILGGGETQFNVNSHRKGGGMIIMENGGGDTRYSMQMGGGKGEKREQLQDSKQLNNSMLPDIKIPSTPSMEDDDTISELSRRHIIPGIGNYKMFMTLPKGLKRDPSFHITPVGYDCRYQDPPRTKTNDDTPDEVKAKAVEKCSDWINRYL